MRALLVYTLRDLRHHLGRTILTVIGLAGVSFSYLLLASVSETMFVFGDQTVPPRNLVVIRNDVLFPTDGSLGESVFQAIAELPADAVQRVSPMIYRQMKVNDLLVQLRAAPFADWESVHGLDLLAGRWPQAQGEVAISEGAVNFAGWQVGERLPIYGTDFRISAIFRASGTKFASVWMTHDEASNLFGEDIGAQMAYVQVAGTRDLEEIRDRLESDPRLDGRYAVYLESRLDGRYYGLVSSMRNIAVILTGIALLGITFGTYNAANLSLIERGRELGILRAVGFSAAVSRAFMMLRVGLQSLIAYVLGAGAAILFVASLRSRGPLVVCAVCRPVRLTPESLLIGLGLILLLAPLGAWLSSRKTWKLSAAQMMGEEGFAKGNVASG